ncbi:N-acetylmuramoyl-L-alanine amidase [Peribacillus acanthi]|uniref:N-acetylmuramoyl-L-alanine amidase n=1 Tax=Peribacillus acanthi TaxID=2171554 RepID=UPI000D3E49F2|nr:N-acetylmuramoyl-L-alanine amidase [Peribacillus acanthi]
MKIVLDAGHGYETQGKRSPDGMKEYEFNRKVALFGRDLLSQYEGVEVIFTHSDQDDVPLQTRTSKANSSQADLFISIHANAYGSGGWSSAEGIETYVYTSQPKEAMSFAQKVHQNLIVATGLENRGIKTANFHVLRETHMTAILVECGFMTNKEEIKLLRSEVYQKTCAEAIVKGVAQFYKLKKKQSSPTAVKTPSRKSSTSLYKVQLGAFQSQDAAEKMANELKKAGYEAIVVKS